jgi:hypothetical protein
VAVAGCAGGTEEPARSSPPQWTPSSYDRLILSDRPVLYLTMGTPEAAAEPDRSGRARSGTYLPAGSLPAATSLPNGDLCARFDGNAQYLELPDADDLSITTTRRLTVEAWMRPDALEFPAKEGTGYVHWMGKGEAGQQEYVLRMYSLTNTESRPSRISGYAFNLSGGEGSGAYFQDPVALGEWIHVVVAFNIDGHLAYRAEEVRMPVSGRDAERRGTVTRDHSELAEVDDTPQRPVLEDLDRAGGRVRRELVQGSRAHRRRGPEPLRRHERVTITCS